MNLLASEDSKVGDFSIQICNRLLKQNSCRTFRLLFPLLKSISFRILFIGSGSLSLILRTLVLVSVGMVVAVRVVVPMSVAVPVAVAVIMTVAVTVTRAATLALGLREILAAAAAHGVSHIF